MDFLFTERFVIATTFKLGQLKQYLSNSSVSLYLYTTFFVEVEELRYKQAGGTLCSEWIWKSAGMLQHESQMIQNLGAGVWQTPRWGWVWCDRWCRQQIHRIMQVAALQVCSHIWSFRKTQMAQAHFKGKFGTLYSNILLQISYSVHRNSKRKIAFISIFFYIVIRTLQEFSPAHAVGGNTEKECSESEQQRSIILTFCPRGGPTLIVLHLP